MNGTPIFDFYSPGSKRSLRVVPPLPERAPPSHFDAADKAVVGFIVAAIALAFSLPNPAPTSREPEERAKLSRSFQDFDAVVFTLLPDQGGVKRETPTFERSRTFFNALILRAAEDRSTREKFIATLGTVQEQFKAATPYLPVSVTSPDGKPTDFYECTNTLIARLKVEPTEIGLDPWKRDVTHALRYFLIELECLAKTVTP
jgi:hypothetical protein